MEELFSKSYKVQRVAGLFNFLDDADYTRWSRKGCRACHSYNWIWWYDTFSPLLAIKVLNSIFLITVA